MKQTPWVTQEWIPVAVPGTAMLDMDTMLSCSLIAWLLARFQTLKKQEEV